MAADHSLVDAVVLDGRDDLSSRTSDDRFSHRGSRQGRRPAARRAERRDDVPAHRVSRGYLRRKSGARAGTVPVQSGNHTLEAKPDAPVHGELTAAALRGGARFQDDIDAVVSRGGRVDMVAEVLDEVRAPILFIVGGNDTQVLEPNREGPDRLTCEAELHVVEGVGHRFERAGELEVAADWFERTLK